MTAAELRAIHDATCAVLPPVAAVTVATDAMWRAEPHPAERAAVAGAVAQRRREYAAGRAAARDGLTRLGLPATAIPSRPDRSPLWPPGVVGSIAHTRDVCVAAVARRHHLRGIGVDVESVARVTPDLAGTILRPDERTDAIDAHGAEAFLALAFSAKESVYKCTHPLTGTFLDFRDVRLEVDLAASTFVARVTVALGSGAVPRVLHGRFRFAAGHVVTAVTVPAPAP